MTGTEGNSLQRSRVPSGRSPLFLPLVRRR